MFHLRSENLQHHLIAASQDVGGSEGMLFRVGNAPRTVEIGVARTGNGSASGSRVNDGTDGRTGLMSSMLLRVFLSSKRHLLKIIRTCFRESFDFDH